MEGWDVVGNCDSRIYRREQIGVGDEGLVFSNGKLLTLSGQEIADGSINELNIVNTVDRLSNDEIVPFWNEVYRVCAHAAVVRLVGAYWTCVDVQSDVTRKRGLSERMIAYLSVPGRESLLSDPMEDGIGVKIFSGIDFDPKSIMHIADPEWETRSNEAKNWALAHNINVIRRLNVIMTAVKPCRT